MSFTTKEERDAIVTALHATDRLLYPGEGAAEPEQQERYRLKERYYTLLGEYADRLPRVPLSVCPFCGAPLKRVFDPWGLDGPWWHTEPTVRYEEPRACEHFRVLLGALQLGGRIPVEAVEEVQPGPAVPFVVPALLRLPHMVAILARIPLATGDLAYPIAYFSDQAIPPQSPPQPWCRTIHWFPNGSGGQSWTIANATFDFTLQPYLASRQLRWLAPDAPEAGIHTLDQGPCPFLDLSGERERQLIAFGERHLIGLPDGELINPFDD